jgi:hypothetical protein
MYEERAAGWLYDPPRVLNITYEKDKINYTSLTEVSKKMGPFILHFKGGSYPFLRLKYKEKTIFLLFSPFFALLYGYIPRGFIEVFGENLFAVRLPILLTFMSLLYFYIRFSEKICGLRNGTLSALFIFSFPLFGMRFLSLISWNQTCVFLFSILLLKRVEEISKRTFFYPIDVFLIFLYGGLILHFHLLAGGALFGSMLFSLFISMKKYGIKFPSVSSLLLGVLVFLLLISPYFFLVFNPKRFLYYFGGDPTAPASFLTPLHTVWMYLAGIIFPSSFIRNALHGDVRVEYVLFSGLPGLLFLYGIYILITNRNRGFFEKFLFWTVMFYLVLSLFMQQVRPYHANFFLLFLSPFIFLHLSKEKLGRIILLISILFNFIQTEICRRDAKNSPLSLSLHKEIVRFLEKENIDKVYNLAGGFGYEFISKKKIEVLDFWNYLYVFHDPLRISSSLFLARRGVIMVERCRRALITTGTCPEEVFWIAKRTGLRVSVLKNFPDDKNPLLTLMRVE